MSKVVRGCGLIPSPLNPLSLKSEGREFLPPLGAGGMGAKFSSPWEGTKVGVTP